jgi:hypothetical protein
MPSTNSWLKLANHWDEGLKMPSPEEMEAYFASRSRVWGNPLITKRNATLGLLKPLFADDISGELSVDFVQLAITV